MESLVDLPFLSFFIELLQLFNHTNKKNLSSSIYISEVKNYSQVNQQTYVSCFKNRKKCGATRSQHQKKPQHMPSNPLFNTYHFIEVRSPPPTKCFPVSHYNSTLADTFRLLWSTREKRNNNYAAI